MKGDDRGEHVRRGWITIWDEGNVSNTSQGINDPEVIPLDDLNAFFRKPMLDRSSDVQLVQPLLDKRMWLHILRLHMCGTIFVPERIFERYPAQKPVFLLFPLDL